MKGIHRERRPETKDEFAWITDGTISMYLVESRYRTSGYLPEWDALEWAATPSAPKTTLPRRDRQ